jgi:crossover junction endodeoxyribonuclease RusA
MNFSFTVFGVPVPQGSSRAFIPRGWTRPIITAANSKTKPWRQEVAGACLARLNGTSSPVSEMPVIVKVAFFFDRPKSTKKSVQHKTTKPDVDKLARSILDALTGIAFADDSQVIELHVTKGFGSPARAEIAVSDSIAA